MAQYHIECTGTSTQYIYTTSDKDIIKIYGQIIMEFRYGGRVIRIYSISPDNDKIKRVTPIAEIKYFTHNGYDMWRAIPIQKSGIKANSRLIYSFSGKFIADEIRSTNGKWKIIPFSDTKHLFE